MTAAFELPAIDPLDRPVYGAANIGRVMGLNENQAFYGLERGHIDADKLGGKWVSTPRRLMRIANGNAA